MKTLPRLPTPSGAMPNAFLVIRTVFFVFLAHVHVLILVFASWNVIAAKSAGMSAPGATVFLLMTSLLTFVLVPIAYLAELVCARARPARVRVECVWTIMMSLFQLAASIVMTLHGSALYCQMRFSWAMCASSSLLVHVSWIATLIIFAYCLAICVVSTAHAASIPDIWITPVPLVPWFRLEPRAPPPMMVSLPTHKHISSSSSWSESSCAVTKYIAERWEKLSRAERQPESSTGPILFTKGRQSLDAARPDWARRHIMRRGVDNPFAKPLPRRQGPPVVLAPPPRTHSRRTVSSREVRSAEVSECERAETTSTHSSATLTPRTPTVFPYKIADPDLPIPLPSRSEWIRADGANPS